MLTKLLERMIWTQVEHEINRRYEGEDRQKMLETARMVKDKSLSGLYQR